MEALQSGLWEQIMVNEQKKKREKKNPHVPVRGENNTE